MSGSLSLPFKRQSAVSFSASATTNDGDDERDAKVSRRVRNASSSNVVDQLSALDADALAALCDSDSSNSVSVPTVSPAAASLSAAMVAGSSPPKALAAAALSATPARLRSTSHRTSFTFTADEPDDGIALLGHDAHKPRKWFSWLARLKPGSAATAAPAPTLPLSSSPSDANGGAAAAAKTTTALAGSPAPSAAQSAPPTVTDVITATSLDELPAEVRVYLNKAGLTDGQIREHWGMVMGIFQLVTKCRVDNAWKEEHKKKLGNPGRDYRGSTDNLLSAADPAKSYRIYHTSPLGHGGFGTVLRAVRLSDSLALAIKTMPNGTAKQKRENLWEIGLLKRAQHPCVVTFYEAFVWADAVWMVMERLDGGSLAHAVALCGGFREPHVAYTAERVLRALDFMHERSLAHRDLKSANLMLSTLGDVKLIDFGLCRDCSRSPGISMLGSPFFISPEMIRYEPHSTPTDIWSFAISLLEMVNGHPPNHNNAVRAMFVTATVGVDLSQWTFSAALTDFLAQCLQRDPLRRAAAPALRKHAFLRKACDRADMQRLLRTIFR
jgi:hypothetical protein